MSAPALRYEAVSFAYPGGAAILRGVDLELAESERVAIIGRNGSGKSTLALHANGILRPSQGRILVHGRDIASVPTSRVAAEVGLLFQDPDLQILEETVGDEVSFGPRNFGSTGAALDNAVADALRAVGLLELVDANPYNLGFARRKLVALASVLAMPSRILVLDEPTTGVDAPTARKLAEVIRGLAHAGKTVMAITHDMRFAAETFDRIVVFSDGRIALDGPPDVVFAEQSWPVLRLAGVRPPDAAILGARLGLGSTPVETDLIARWRAYSSDSPEPA